MDPTPLHRLAAIAACVALGATATACGDDDDATASSADTATVSRPTEVLRPATTPATTVESVVATFDPATSAAEANTVADGWKQEAAAICAAYVVELPSEPDPAVAGFVELVSFWRDLRDRVPSFDQLDLPDELRTAPTDVPAVMRQADAALERAETAAAAGDDATTDRAINVYGSLLEQAAALVTIAGAQCGDPARAAAASLNVPLPTVGQVAAGFGSVWVSQSPNWSTVVRVDPDSGQVLATVDTETAPLKAQPADGRMIVRTGDAYVAIDPATNTIVATLAKSDVGPAANRSWAVDGAMWICDDQRLHRYDPATFEPAGTVIELGIDCGQVYATTDLVVAWTYNEDGGESGTSAAVFIDPTTNQVLGTTSLPADATVPIVLEDGVFFPANKGTLNAVVDRGTWTVTATPDYGREIGGSQFAFDGRSIYLIADRKDVLVVDAQSYEPTDVIEPLTIVSTVNALAHTPGALWVATGDTGILQRFDVP